MSSEDPFESPDNFDKTVIIKPRPGGWQQPKATSRSAPVAPKPDHARPVASVAALPRRLETGLNPLVSAANVLLGLLPQLRATLSHPDPVALRDHLVHEVKIFEETAKRQGIVVDTAIAARYALCTVIDETVRTTPWGDASIWHTQGLLVTFHNEAWGGEKFFRLLQKALQDPSGNRDLLELLYLCLCFGFEGRYRVEPNGREQLQDLREQLYNTLQSLHGEFERDLSPHWQGVVDKRNPIVRFVPLWVASALAAVAMAGLYLWLTVKLNRASDVQFNALHAVHWETPLPKRELPAMPHPEPKRPSAPRLSKFLAPEISARLLTVEELTDRATVRISGDNLFASGSASINPAYGHVIDRIADGLSQVSGTVMVTGHTDDRPIRTLRFPSNWHLSEARAKAVVDLLGKRLQATDRLTAEGRGEAEPVAPNDVPANRARNRRVEITLMQQAGERP